MKRRPHAGRLTMAMLALLLSGCLSIPVSTLWKLRKFDEKTVRSLDPAVLQGVVLNQSGPKFSPDGLRIHVRLDVTKPVTKCFRTELRLRILDIPPPPDLPRVPKLASGDNWTVLGLDEPSIQRFLKVKSELQALPDDANVKMDFDADFGAPTKLAAPIPAYHTDVWMLLHPQEGWLLLFDHLAVDPADDAKQNDGNNSKAKVAETPCGEIL